MKTHTPAPWIFCTYTNKDFGVYAEDAPSGKDIALVRNYYDNETNEANANLIAAAPELLAFAQKWVEFRNGEDTDPKELWYMATQAITKAEGG